MTALSLYWLRQDFRLADNPALIAAAAQGPLVALYVHDESLAWAQGAASRWWLHSALQDIAQQLAQKGIKLILRRGSAAKIVPEVAQALGATTVHWNRAYEPAAIARDSALKDTLKQQGHKVESHNGRLLFEPWTIKTQQGGFYKVYTPFSRACFAAPAPPTPRPVPNMQGANINIASDDLSTWGLLPTAPDWAGGLRQSWVVSESAAQQRLESFIAQGMAGYKTERDRPDKPKTSALSPYLHFGQISAGQIWAAAQHSLAAGQNAADAQKFINELLWREFSYHLLYHLPHLPETPLQPRFENFPWEDKPNLLKLWQRGQTGYPIVDAGMRQLWQTGWMHNRVRMIAASFLIKDLFIDWRLGQKWFWDTLVDADLANNAASWQWVAGCGADAAPYFRIFNPIIQGERFDPEGDYVRRFVPELAALPKKYIHRPWEAEASILAKAGVTLGKTYPMPIVDHASARNKALEIFSTLGEKDL